MCTSQSLKRLQIVFRISVSEAVFKLKLNEALLRHSVSNLGFENFGCFPAEGRWSDEDINECLTLLTDLWSGL